MHRYILVVYIRDRVEPDDYTQKLILLFEKNDITKFLWGDLGASPPQLFGHGGR